MKIKPWSIYIAILSIVGFLVFSVVLQRAVSVAGSRVTETAESLQTAAIAYPILLLLTAPSLLIGIIIAVGGVILYLLNSATNQGGKIPFGTFLIVIILPVLVCPICLMLFSLLQQ
jgi:hypothetical protein